MFENILFALLMTIALSGGLSAISLNTISSVQAKNATGYKRLYITAVENVAAIAAHSAHVISSDITMVTDQVFYKVLPDGEGGAWLSIEEPEAEGTTGYLYTLNVFIAGDTAALKDDIDAIDGVDLIVLGEKKDGVIELIGEIDRGIRLRINKEDGAKPGTRKGYLLTGQQDFNNLPYEYSGTIAE